MYTYEGMYDLPKVDFEIEIVIVRNVTYGTYITGWPELPVHWQQMG